MLADLDFGGELVAWEWRSAFDMASCATRQTCVAVSDASGAIQHFGGDVPFERNAQAVERRPQPVAQVPQPLGDGGAALVVQVVDGHLQLEQAGLQRHRQAVGSRGLRVLAGQQGHQPGAHAVVQVVGDATALGHHRLRLAPLGHAALR
jgi:hypothetical protein